MLDIIALLPLLFAQHDVGGGSYSVGQIAIAIVVIVSVIGILLVILRVNGVQIPAWVWTICWICLGAFVAILAIRFVLSL